MNEDKRWPRPAHDAERVAALHDLGVLDTPEDVDLAAVVRVASYVCGTPMAAVNLIDADRQWQAAAHGFVRGEVSRDDSMCAWSILQPGVTYTPDASRDDVFGENPFVTGEIASVRLYASAPVVVEPGHVVGSLCAFSAQPGDLTHEQIDRLADLAGAAARILELRKSLGRAEQAAATDPLSGLRNRSVFRDALRRSLGLFHDGTGTVGVLFLDLNRFKPVNDRFGHQAGDAVLRAVADRLTATVRESDLVARMGGDEFAILVQAPTESELADRLDRIGERIAARVGAPLVLDDGSEVSIGVAIGRAIAKSYDTPDSLLARADAAMYAEKELDRPVAEEAGR